ncbi:Peptidyl-prolyl cis-trans isomerase-like 2 [Exophiala dermatitidis]
MGDEHPRTAPNGQASQANNTQRTISELPSDLEALILSRFDQLVEKGELIWEPSTAEVVEDRGFKAEIRYVPHLRRKPIIPPDAPERKTGTGRNPFLNPDPSFVLSPVGPEHLLMLNKYCVYRPSLLLITKQFVPQSNGLDATDLAAAWAFLRHSSLSRPYMMIYNCGYDAGSSQGHKHMQLWEYPGQQELGFELFPNKARSKVDITSDIENVPHQHFVLRLPENADVAHLVNVYNRLLAEVHKAHHEAGSGNEGGAPYNVILVKEWMCLVPRRHCGLERGAGANAAAIVGMVWISLLEEREIWTASPSLKDYYRPFGRISVNQAKRDRRNMGKGTDKLYITHSEWASSDAYSASAGAGVRADTSGHASFKRLPFNHCALSLQPFNTPVCTSEGTIFDHENIIRWLLKHDTNPTNGQPLKQQDLIKLNFAKNDSGEYVDPVTFKVFTDNTHIVAIRHGDSANVFAYDTVERLNIKPRMWRDLVSDEEFSRKDLIVLQDPQNVESRNLSTFKYLREGEDSGIPKEEASINTASLGSAADLKIIKAKEAVAKARAERANAQVAQAKEKSQSGNNQVNKSSTSTSTTKPAAPYNATRHTTGLAAASFTSTGVTPHTSAALALMSDEEYLLKRGRVKEKGYVRLSTSVGDLTLELYPEYAPKAVWNFIRLAQKGYYNGIICHRNIRNFMIQTGDPTGTGRGGTSIWGKNFEDEIEGPLKHDARGVVSMANKGKNTNSSQFFITYRPATHLNLKHTIFGRVVDESGSFDVLKKLEDTPVDSNDRPTTEIKIVEAVVLIDPFEEFWKKKNEAEQTEKKKEQRQDEDRTTWTGKRIRADGTVESGTSGDGVGKYLKAALANTSQKPEQAEDEIVEFIDEPEEPVRKKAKSGGGGFGNFDSW